MSAEMEDRRLTQPDWCNDPQPSNWRNACMRASGHEGDHAARKSYNLSEAWYWRDGVVGWRRAAEFPDIWNPDDDDDTPGAARGDES